MTDALNDPAGATPADIELPRGLALNSVRIVCPGEHLVTRFVKPHDYSRDWRRALEAETGHAVFVGEEFVYASGEIEHPKGGATTVACDAESGELCVFMLRQAVVGHARERGLEAWVNRYREVTVAGLLPVRAAGEVIVEPLLVMRVLREGFDVGELYLVARPRVRSYLSGSLATLGRPQELVDQTAQRVSGDGPTRATIVSVDPAGEVKLVTRRGDESSWPAGDYTVVATPELIRARYGPQAWSNVQVAIGALTQNKRRNTYAVKDRFVAATDGVNRLGSELQLPGGSIAVLEREWSEVRVEEQQ